MEPLPLQGKDHRSVSIYLISPSFVLTAAVLKPAVRIITELGFVRNSIGSEAYVADEIITSHAGMWERLTVM